MRRIVRRRMAGYIAAILGAAAVGGLGGCVGYASYPPVPGDTAINDPNHPPMNEMMATALRWAAEEFPVDPADPNAPYAVNLPVGVRPETYEFVLGRIGGAAMPLTHGTATLPTFHVKRIRVRGDSGQVDILRPVRELSPSPTGEPVYQEVTVRMEGGWQPWHVVGRREWSMGAGQAPEPNYLDDLLMARQRPAAAPPPSAAGAEQPAPEAPAAGGDEAWPEFPQEDTGEWIRPKQEPPAEGSGGR